MLLGKNLFFFPFPFFFFFLLRKKQIPKHCDEMFYVCAVCSRKM